MPEPDLVKVVFVTFKISLPITSSLLVKVGQEDKQSVPIQKPVALTLPFTCNFCNGLVRPIPTLVLLLYILVLLTQVVPSCRKVPPDDPAGRVGQTEIQLPPIQKLLSALTLPTVCIL